MGLITVILPARLDSYLLSIIRCVPCLIFVIPTLIDLLAPRSFLWTTPEYSILPWYGNN